MNERLQDFIENFGKPPDEPPPPLIPQRWRIPVFATTAIVALLVLVLFLWLLVIPAIQKQSQTAKPATTVQPTP